MSTDALSDVLSAVRLSRSAFFDVTAKSPWVAEAPPGVSKIAAIAHEIGYESEAAFSRAFKKFVGRSPSQWRTASS